MGFSINYKPSILGYPHFMEISTWKYHEARQNVSKCHASWRFASFLCYLYQCMRMQYLQYSNGDWNSCAPQQGPSVPIPSFVTFPIQCCFQIQYSFQMDRDTNCWYLLIYQYFCFHTSPLFGPILIKTDKQKGDVAKGEKLQMVLISTPRCMNEWNERNWRW